MPSISTSQLYPSYASSTKHKKTGSTMASNDTSKSDSSTSSKKFSDSLNNLPKHSPLQGYRDTRPTDDTWSQFTARTSSTSALGDPRR
ncbi:hypothetical protein HO173_008932 [Letharia columbiana]|uniref:Uncharacterized protein n=1 Tax=Letharia columbiana TaxID=112416 RepID=A0A8H6FQR2_9LECA|nr:uncharacterized protein HO173_008932 [Letharia columbiana]KAF6232969.1 hypothetical protein HO173_008932 [Letharia columbiana]